MPAPDRVLYLFKAARRPIYRKENLHLLAAERGTVVEVVYNRSWAPHALLEPGAVPAGTRAVLVYADRPYALFVPTREAEVLETEQDDVGLRLRLVLGNWVRPEGLTIEEFTRRVRDADPAGVPGSKFIAWKKDDAVLAPCYDEREDEGWRGVVDGVLAMSRGAEGDPYQGSVFFRPLGLRLEQGDELLAGRRAPLEPGARAALVLRFHNPHLTPDELAECRLRALAPEDALAVDAPAAIPPTGDVELGLRFLGGSPELTVQVTPAPAQHTSLVQRFGTRAGASGGGAARSAPARDELRRLWSAVRRNARIDDPGDELDLIDAFERLVPGEAALVERKVLIHAARGEDDLAYPLLRGLERETLGDEARFRPFRYLLERDAAAAPAHVVESLGLLSDGRHARFLASLDELDARALARLLPALVLEFPGEQATEVVARAGGRLESAEACADTAFGLWAVTGDPAGAFAFLASRRRELRTDHPRVIDVLLELAEAGGREGEDAELALDAQRRIANLIERGSLDEARARLRMAGNGLRRGERDRLYHRVADRLVARSAFSEAASALVELAYLALAAGDLEEATEAAGRARGVWGLSAGSGAAVPTWLSEAVSRTEVAWTSCKDVVEWRQTAEERVRASLRAKYLIRRILIAGGVAREDVRSRLAELTGAAVDWAVAYRSEVADLASFCEKIRNGHYAAVVYLWQKTGHSTGDRIRAACEEAGVEVVWPTGVGVRGIVEAMEKRLPEPS